MFGVLQIFVTVIRNKREQLRNIWPPRKVIERKKMEKWR